MADRQQQAREREEEAKAWTKRVTEVLLAQQSSFAKEFDENEKRIFGLTKDDEPTQLELK
jgi:hypothetical protein